MPRILLALALAAAVPGSELRFGGWTRIEADGAPLPISYFNLLPPGPDRCLGLWFAAASGAEEVVVGLAGEDLRRLPRAPPRFAASLAAYDRDLGGRTSPILSRVSVARLRDGRHVALAMIGPAYRGGASELLPTLFASASGAAGTWRLLGPPAGEPAAEIARRRAGGSTVRSDGGALIELPDGRLRLLLHWDDRAGIRLAAMDAAAPEGPWRFVRDARGAIRNLAPPGTWLFPHVAAVDGRWLLTGADAWPPTAIHGAWSEDALAFTPVAQPLLRAGEVAPGATQVKALRVAWDPATRTLHGVANPLVGGEWILHSATAVLAR